MSETEQQEGEERQVIEEQTTEQLSDGLSLVSALGGHRLHPTTWAPTEPARLVPTCVCMPVF